MGRPCTVCHHAQRDAIDRALLEREPDARLAKRVGLSRFAVQRHSRAHIAPALALAAQEREIVRSDDLLEKLEDLGRVTLEILQEARATKSQGIALKAIARAESQLELQARLLGQLRGERVAVNVNLSPEAAQKMAEVYLARRRLPIEIEAR